MATGLLVCTTTSAYPSPVVNQSWCLQLSDGLLYAYPPPGTWVPLTSSPILSGYATASLPSPVLGLLSRTTDNLNAIYYGNGTQNYPLGMGCVNVMDFGAKWDGATDDTAACTAAVAALPSTGGIVLLPAGTGVVLNWTITKGGVTIIGQGNGWEGQQGATRLMASNAATSSDDTIRFGGGSAIYGGQIRDVYVTNATPGGVTSAGRSISANQTGFRAVRCFFSAGIATPPGNTISTVVNGVASDSWDSGGFFDCIIYGSCLIAASSVRFERCYFYGNNTFSAIKYQCVSAGAASYSLSVLNCNFDGHATPVIDCGNPSVSTVGSILIAGCRCGGAAAGTGTWLNLGDSTNGISNVAVIGNYFPGGTESSEITVTGGEGVTITGNYIASSIILNIVLSASLANLRIADNYAGNVSYNSYSCAAITLYGGAISGTWEFRGAKVHTTGAVAVTGISFPITNATVIGVHVRGVGSEASTTGWWSDWAGAWYGSGGVANYFNGGYQFQRGSDTNASATATSASSAIAVIGLGEAGHNINWLIDADITVR